MAARRGGKTPAHERILTDREGKPRVARSEPRGPVMGRFFFVILGPDPEEHTMKIPEKVPENGFYYHYKHEPDGSVSNYAYEVVGVGCHTEDNCRPEDANMVVYRPLYESSVYAAGKLFDLRPLDMWMGNVSKDGESIPRFRKITDSAIVAELSAIRNRMY